jgi:hypothetical protein
MTQFYDYEEIRKIYARLDGMSSRISMLENLVRLQSHSLRAQYYLMEAAGVSLEKQENWMAELLGDTVDR